MHTYIVQTHASLTFISEEDMLLVATNVILNYMGVVTDDTAGSGNGGM